MEASEGSIVNSQPCFPNELWPAILGYSNSALFSVCKLFHKIFEDKSFMHAFLKQRYQHHYLATILNSNDTPENALQKAKETLLKQLSGKISDATTAIFNKNDASPSLPDFMRILKEEEAFNLFKLSQAFPESLASPFAAYATEFDELSLMQKGEKVRAFLKSEAMQPTIQSLTSWEVNWKSLTMPPQELDLFTGLKQLDLNYNNISYLPSSLGSNWQNLEQLHIAFNHVASIVPTFGDHWHALTRFSISNNKLTDLPEDFGSSWKKLQFLRIKSPGLPIDVNSIEKKFPDLLMIS